MSIVVRATLAEQAYQELRTRILSGRLAGGQRLLPEELSVELAISPTPIKEALLRLESDGLVEWPLRRGAVVRRFTTHEVEELYEARLLIELNAVARIFERGANTPAFIETLRGNLARHAFHAGREGLDELSSALAFDREFHQHIVLAAGNALVAEWHLRILRQTHTVFVYNAGNYARSVDEHRTIIEAFAAGYEAAVRNAVETHLIESRNNTLANIVRESARSTPS
ncbi:DNA-binding transcriptional regulator, GntR family [Pseudoxanthobacter soli DSM 19599]|uniref:DNA-binding transcriptional regulator, GntR family n=1 Tax=Pseudoxanthobacter soli DSM 19599 TaxID=1123029 RepID=A0A1M7ZRA0_9HYPH|nr:GntR family transcriptional regulator [Pseudoxanthobacter soli]SHO67433.1 DNA-binding transcriptional regulator, GntR family [Pseudoxanthobacter soli DSM 19599]